jgi:hypothetical protein
MVEAGADTRRVSEFLALCASGTDVRQALVSAVVPRPAAKFVAATWGMISSEPVHCQAAAFAFGREDLIPEMFQKIITIDEGYGRLGLFRDYLARHIDVDEGLHKPMAMRMLIDLCGDDDSMWADCAQAVQASLAARQDLWDGILDVIRG